MEKVRFGVPSGDDLPTHDAGAGAEEHDHAPVSVGARYDSAIDAPAPRFAGQQRGRGGREPHRAGDSQARGFALTGWLALESAAEDLPPELWLCGGLDGPQGAPHGDEVLRLSYLLVSQELRPGPDGCVRQVLGGSIGVAVPPPAGLILALPDEREPRIGVTKQDHVAEEKSNERASSETAFGPWSSGVQRSPSSSIGAFPCRAVLGR